MSFIIHPTLPERKRLGHFPLLSGLALCTALESAYPLSPRVKWPNDILLAGKKTAGILVESAWHGDQLKGLVAGIGVNLLPDAVPQDINLLFPATCVQDHSPQNIDAYMIIQETIRAFKSIRVDLLNPSFIDHYTQKLAYRDKLVELQTASDSSVSGYLKGIAEDGGLLLRTGDNTVTKYPVGDLRLRPKE
jgi:BirA family biotin operon repressor/biotin-[acetyl-CoA-carboxylase] ligase